MNFARTATRRLANLAERLHRGGLLKALTLSAQSMTPLVLEAIERKNMAFSDFATLLELCNSRGIPTYTELILGLPGETYESWKLDYVWRWRPV